MIQQGRVIKILRPLGALAHTALAFNTGARDRYKILQINGPHGTHPGTGSAAGAFFQMGLRLRLQEIHRLTVRPLRNIVGCIRITRHPHRLRNRRQAPHLQGHSSGKALHLKLVAPAGTAIAQLVRHGMLCHKGSRGHRMESVCLQQGAQLRQRVVIAPVAKGHHRHRQRSVSVQPLLIVRQDLIGQLSRVCGGTHYNQIRFLKMILSGPFHRLCKTQLFHGAVQLCRQFLRQRLYGPIRIARGAVTDRPDFGNFHHLASFAKTGTRPGACF